MKHHAVYSGEKKLKVQIRFHGRGLISELLMLGHAVDTIIAPCRLWLRNETQHNKYLVLGFAKLTPTYAMFGIIS